MGADPRSPPSRTVTRRVHLRADALADLQRALDWYDEQREGLGAELTVDLDGVLSRVAELPESFPIVQGSIRRALLVRFPYAVYFRPVGLDLQVLAIFHARRDPAELDTKLQ